MFLKHRKFFRFRFRQVMALILLLTSPTQATNELESCTEIWKATATAPDSDDNFYTLVQDPKFMGNFAECIHEILEADIELVEVKPIIQQLQEFIEKAQLRLKQEGGRVLLSTYALIRNFELFNRATDLDLDFTIYREEFEAWKDEIKIYKNVIVTQLIPLWEQGNTDSLIKITGELLGRMSRHLAVIQELIQSIHRAGDNTWYSFYIVTAVVTCVFSISSGIEIIIGGTCGAGAFTIMYTFMNYRQNCDTLEKLDVLGKEVDNIRKDITKYRAQQPMY